jgi:Uma2 family endonuclease
MSTAALFSLDDYDHMIACGAFAPPHDRRCELIRGEIRDMSPIGPEHGEMVDWLNEWSFAVMSRRSVRIRIQSSIGIPELGSAPEPDVVWAERKSYAQRRPEPQDVLLLIEVADSSLQYDLGEKADLYAEAGITDYWVVDIRDFRIHVHRQPTAEGFQSLETFAMGDTVHPLCKTDATLNVAELFNGLQ